MKSPYKQKAESHNPLIKAGLIGLTILACNSAMAEVRVAAFSDGRGFASLMAGDIEKADKALPQSARSHLDYSDTNNLCVLQILQKDEVTAIKTCKSALGKLNAAALDMKVRRSHKADILTNLAVAQLLSGNISGAEDSLTKALSFSVAETEAGEQSNAEINEAVLRTRYLAAK